MKYVILKKDSIFRIEARKKAFKKPCMICGYIYKSFKDVRSFYKPNKVDKPISKNSFYCCCSSCVLNKRNTIEAIEKALK
jgi:hypothetical protein